MVVLRLGSGLIGLAGKKDVMISGDESVSSESSESEEVSEQE